MLELHTAELSPQMAMATMDHMRRPSFADGLSDSSSMMSSNCSPSFSCPDDFMPPVSYFPNPVFPYGYNMPQTYTITPPAIPIEFGIESLYEDLDRHKQKNPRDKTATTQRRRAQNRASQRAFRERKEKHVKEVEKQFRELEGKYDILSQSYETLQHEYMLVKKELDELNAEQERNGSFSPTSSVAAADMLQSDSPYHLSRDPGVAFDPLIFDDSLFRFDEDSSIPQAETQTKL